MLQTSTVLQCKYDTHRKYKILLFDDDSESFMQIWIFWQERMRGIKNAIPAYSFDPISVTLHEYIDNWWNTGYTFLASLKQPSFCF